MCDANHYTNHYDAVRTMVAKYIAECRHNALVAETSPPEYTGRSGPSGSDDSDSEFVGPPDYAGPSGSDDGDPEFTLGMPPPDEF